MTLNFIFVYILKRLPQCVPNHVHQVKNIKPAAAIMEAKNKGKKQILIKITNYCVTSVEHLSFNDERG